MFVLIIEDGKLMPFLILIIGILGTVKCPTELFDSESRFRGLYVVVACFALLALLGISVVYLFYKWSYRYWSNQNVRATNPKFPLGDISQAAFNKNIGVVLKEIYERFDGERFNGMWCFYRPYLMIRDPDLIRIILVRDFNYFRDRGLYFNEKEDPLSANLFFMGGTKWRILRTKLSTNFSSGKMKKIFKVMAEKSMKLKDILEISAVKKEIIEPKEFTIRYTHEIAAVSLLGLEEDCLENNTSILPTLGKKVFEPSWSNIIRTALGFFLPDLAVLLRITITPEAVSNFFLRYVKNLLHVEGNEIIEKVPNDFMRLLVKLKNEGKLENVDENGNISKTPTEKHIFSCENAAAQAFIFWMGAFESSASTMQFALFEMSLNTEIQERAREEVRNVLHRYNGKITYESLSELEYLGRVIDETLRKYPPVPLVARICLETYRIPDSDVVIEKGVPILISVSGLHMDPLHYPNPEKFDPNRFTDEEKRKRHRYAYLPFGGGLHQCLGQRYALMQIKLGLANLLANYKFETAPDTRMKAKICRKVVLYTVKNGIPLKISKLCD